MIVFVLTGGELSRIGLTKALITPANCQRIAAKSPIPGGALSQRHVIYKCISYHRFGRLEQTPTEYKYRINLKYIVINVNAGNTGC
jgi:hypothetical protein